MTDFTPLFDRARDEEFGLKVKTNNPTRMQITLCNFAREHNIRDIMACVVSLEGYVFLVKKSVELS